MKTLKIIAISDTHNYLYPLDKLPEADVFIHAGDSCTAGTTDELIRFSHWLDKVAARYKHVIYMPGNHDRAFDGSDGNRTARSILTSAHDNIHVLINEELTIENCRFFGSPVTPPVGKPWYYYYSPNNREAIWEQMAYMHTLSPIDVLVTHGPPYRVGDKLGARFGAGRWPFVGCKDLRQYVERVNPAVHIFGHVHEAYGCYGPGDHDVKKADDSLVRTMFVNASIRDDYYIVANKAWLITLEQLGNSWEFVEIEAVDG